ncbi:hydroxymethylpyrimidine/phosphomethylpyrimidine kinase [Methylococcus sp. EFPC2]|nr:bifunctional hydroxymethylpyrimidine kinase/phosphomethylpyrimidine kinase [Methylococcus sp. EFPC2]QSA95685.1 hydroxymethylpyrimidine/phosphomethylpyrimidine kinase [Methylococcus sp. EFPC2]
MSATTRTVFCLSGHDATGGAGLQADIETLKALGCHPLTVVTALTSQDTVNVEAVWPQRECDFMAQAECLLNDIQPVSVKIGLLGSADIARAVAEILRRLPHACVVLDPILAAGGGKPLARAELMDVMRAELFPRVTVLTPNTIEARALVGRKSLDECAEELRRLGCKNVLITGTHDTGEVVINRLYGHTAREWSWPRLPHTYHGSGCTLASALAGFLALGQPLETAAYSAQRFTFEALQAGYPLGRGQYMPNRAAPRPELWEHDAG